MLSAKREAQRLIGKLSDRDLTMFALGLYAGEGAKTKGGVGLANTNPTYLRLFVTWLRHQFDVDERRLRARIYLHQGLDIAAATAFWAAVVDIPEEQFTQPYRAAADPTLRLTKHEFGCATVRYSCSRTLRRLLAMIEAVSLPFAHPG